MLILLWLKFRLFQISQFLMIMLRLRCVMCGRIDERLAEMVESMATYQFDGDFFVCADVCAYNERKKLRRLL